MGKVKVALIGLGFMGSSHWNIYKHLPHVELTAFADVDAAKREGDLGKVVANLGGDGEKKLDLAGIKVYADAFEMIRETDADIIDICVPTTEHTKYILAALKAGKHVFSEKPLCRTREEMILIADAVRKSKTFFNAGLCIRAWPEYRHAKLLVDSGKLGAVRSALFRRLSPNVDGNSWDNWYMDGKRSGGAMFDLHMHDTDAVCYFFGAPRSVTSFGAHAVVSKNDIDHIMTCYHYDKDILITAEGGWAAPKCVPFEMSFQIICEKATIKLDASGYHIYHNDGTIETPELHAEDLPTGWHQELNYFTKCVLSGEKPVRYQTLESILQSFAVMLAEVDAVGTGKTTEVKYV